MPHSPSNEYLDDIYRLKDVFLENMKNDSDFVVYCKRDNLDKNGWIELYALALNKIKYYIDISNCLWSDFDWVFTELVEEYLKYATNSIDQKIRIFLYGLYIKNKDKILFEVYYGDVKSFLQDIDKYCTDSLKKKSDDPDHQ